MHILITGGGGYLGSTLVPALLDAGHGVTVLDRFDANENALLGCCGRSGFEVVRGDCRNEAALRPLLESADAVIPLAAVVGAPACEKDPVTARSTNLDAIRLLLHLRPPRLPVIFPNTNSGYGIGEAGTFCTEDSPLRPISLYGVTKVEAEQAVLDAGQSVAFRLATVFGVSPRMRTDLLVNDFVLRAVTDRSVVLFEGDAKRNYIHVKDVARVFLHAIENFDAMQGRPYNVGLSDANLSKRELCARIREHVPEFTVLDAAIGRDPDQRDYVVSNERIEATGFKPTLTLDDGIRELIQAYGMLRPNKYTST